MTMAKRVLGSLLMIGAIVTGLYWWSFFTTGDVIASHERWYLAFESSFPAADSWMALCMLAAGLGFLLQRAWAAPFGLMAGSALVYLAAMDITFNVENAMYALAAPNDAMKFEILTNATTFILGVWTLLASWPRQPAH